MSERDEQGGGPDNADRATPSAGPSSGQERPVDRSELGGPDRPGEQAPARGGLGFGDVPAGLAAASPAPPAPEAAAQPGQPAPARPTPGAGSHWLPGAAPPPPAEDLSGPAAEGPAAAHRAASAPVSSGVPARPNPLPPPRPSRPAGAPVGSVPRSASPPGRPAGAPRPVARSRTARLVLRRVDPWSVFLYSVVSSIFLGIALFVAVGVLYAVLSQLGVLTSVNKLIGDVTAAPGTTAKPSNVFSGAKIMTFAALLAALNVVLLTALATLGAFLYNLCTALTGGIEVTLSDRDAH